MRRPFPIICWRLLLYAGWDQGCHLWTPEGKASRSWLPLRWASSVPSLPLSLHLSFCLNVSLRLIHVYLPKPIITSSFTPILKNKAGKSSDTCNYRPIPLTSFFNKVFEKAILSMFSAICISNYHHFDFKSSHSTDLCIYAFKETVYFYLQPSTPVFVTFMHPSKAFDRVCRWTLFSKLLERNLPVLILSLFIFWYYTQTVFILWGGGILLLILLKCLIVFAKVASYLLFFLVVTWTN